MKGNENLGDKFNSGLILLKVFLQKKGAILQKNMFLKRKWERLHYMVGHVVVVEEYHTNLEANLLPYPEVWGNYTKHHNIVY